MSEAQNQLWRSIKRRSELLWEEQCQAADVEAWLRNFSGRFAEVEMERLHALHLLASVSYFGLRELRVMLRSLYRDYFRYPLIQRIRAEMNATRDYEAVNSRYSIELQRTRFMGVGNPAESGTHLLYYFRQENRIPRALFINHNELFSGPVANTETVLGIPELRRLVFVDDLCGSGDQAIRYSRTLLRDLRTIADRTGMSLELHYLVLFGTTTGLKKARDESTFDVVAAVNELDESYSTFGERSRIMSQAPEFIDPSVARAVAQGYGEQLWKDWPLGYKDSQLLLAFHHNVPNNSLPILWYDEGEEVWMPAFPRYPKID